MTDIPIKHEDGVSPRPIDDDDLYEDGDGPGDLEFFNPKAEANAGKMYMVRLPKALWKAWSKLDGAGDDDEIQIGTLRIWKGPSGHTNFKMLLNSAVPETRAVPREYDLDIQAANVNNMFVFSEQDMPGFKAKSKSRSDAISAGIPLSALRPKSEKVEKPKYERGRREPYYRKAIPKKTRIAGKILFELNCSPQHVEEQNHLLQAQIAEVEKAGQLKIINHRLGQVIQAGSRGALGAERDNKFIKSQPKPTKARKMELKTTRMPENELMDLLFKCFSRFAYWPLRALKANVRQPEAWLRQVLEQIAILQKTGTFANTWTLKDEYQHMVKDPNSVAPDVAESDDDDEDDVTLEDVV